MSSHVFNKTAWAKLDDFNQLGNIGSEVGRALRAKHSGDEQSMKSALARGLDLIDETVKLWAARKSPRIHELLRARELFAQSITTDFEDPTLENYFFQYALAARRNR